jgi:uncharacterized protein YcfL
MDKYLKIFSIGFFVVAFTLFVAACSTSGIVGGSGKSTNGSEMVEIQNKSLAKKLSIENFNTRVINDLLNVQVSIENQFTSSQEFQYKFAWFDVTGFEIEAEGNTWHTLVLHGKEMKTIQALAPNPTVRKYKIVLREL